MKTLYKITDNKKKFRGIFNSEEFESALDNFDASEVGESIATRFFGEDFLKEFNEIFGVNIDGVKSANNALKNEVDDDKDQENEVDDKDETEQIGKNVEKKEKSKNKLKYTGAFKIFKKMSAKKLIDMAEKYKGAPYKLGGENFSGIDCSGLVVAAANEAGVAVGDTTAAGFYKMSEPLNKNEPVKPGYAMFWTDPYVKHIAIVKSVNPDGTFTTIESTTDGKKGVQNLRRKLKPGREIRKLPFINV